MSDTCIIVTRVTLHLDTRVLNTFTRVRCCEVEVCLSHAPHSRPHMYLTVPRYTSHLYLLYFTPLPQCRIVSHTCTAWHLLPPSLTRVLKYSRDTAVRACHDVIDHVQRSYVQPRSRYDIFLMIQCPTDPLYVMHMPHDRSGSGDPYVPGKGLNWAIGHVSSHIRKHIYRHIPVNPRKKFGNTHLTVTVLEYRRWFARCRRGA